MDDGEIEAELRDALARLLRDRCDVEAVRAVAAGDDGWDRALWSELVAMGVPGLATPVAYGGQGGGYLLLAVAQEELGRRLAPVPLLSSVVAQAALGAAGEPAAVELRVAVAAGERTVAVVVGRTADGWRAEPGIRAAVAGTGGAVTLTGSADVVAECASAEVLLVAATTDDGRALVAVDAPVSSGGAGAAGGAGPVVLGALDALDPTRPLARVTFDAAPGTLLAGPGEFEVVLGTARRVALFALAAESVGVAAEATDLAVSYAKIRHQFGRPIGMYQAVSHRCADMFVSVQAARALVLAAASALDASVDEPLAGRVAGEELDLAVSLAAAEAFDAAVAATGSCLQIHGGLGFTWEHPVHNYLRRAKANEALVAVPDRLREQAARQLVATAAARAGHPDA